MGSPATTRGFSLIEALVALLIFAIVIIGVLDMLDKSVIVSKVETSLADTQENVRYAAYHILRMARMAGGSTMPFYMDDGAGNAFPVAGHVFNNQTSSVTIPGRTAPISVAAGTDVLVLRGFFEQPVYYVRPAASDVDTTSQTVTIHDSSTVAANGELVVPYNGDGLVLMAGDTYAVAAVSGASAEGTTTTGSMTFSYVTTTAAWDNLNTRTGSSPHFVTPNPAMISRVGVLHTYAYFVSPDNVLRRWRSSGGTDGVIEDVALNVAQLQVALGVDVNDDGSLGPGEWFYDGTTGAPTAANLVNDLNGDGLNDRRVLGLRITVLGRTPFAVPGWTQPSITVEDMPALTGDALQRKWRRVQVTAALRNFVG